MDRAHRIGLNAAVVAGHQHAPLGQRHEQRIKHLELDRQLDGLATDVKPDGFNIRLQLTQHPRVIVRLKTRHLEIGRQRHLQHIDPLIDRAKRLRIGAGKRHQRRIETRPDIGVSVGCRTRRGIKLRVVLLHTLQVRQRRHVHDGHAGQTRLGDAGHQLPDAVLTVLRLLHRQNNQVKLGQIDHLLRRAGMQTAGQLA